MHVNQLARLGVLLHSSYTTLPLIIQFGPSLIQAVVCHKFANWVFLQPALFPNLTPDRCRLVRPATTHTFRTISATQPSGEPPTTGQYASVVAKLDTISSLPLPLVVPVLEKLCPPSRPPTNSLRYSPRCAAPDPGVPTDGPHSPHHRSPSPPPRCYPTTTNRFSHTEN